MGQDDVETYTINGFRPHADNLTLETDTNLEADVNLELCDDDGSNCSAHSVKKTDGSDGTHQINGLIYIRSQENSWRSKSFGSIIQVN